MEEIKRREWSYTLMLALSIGLFFLMWKLEWINLEPNPTGTDRDFGSEYIVEAVSGWMDQILAATDVSLQDFQKGREDNREEDQGDGQQAEVIETKQETATKEEDGGEEKGIEETPKPETEPSEGMDIPTQPRRPAGAEQPFQAEVGYFDDALFIGDSRTVGLMEYGDLGRAEVLADSGMSVYKIRKSTFQLRNSTKTTLDELLAARGFGKVYLMLGINELGYDFKKTVERYKELVELIQENQPEALIFLQANLHITNRKSAASEYYTNENIDRFNTAVSELADGKHIFYLDVNPLFDAEDGGLNPEVTTDETHILGKYYSIWVDWLLTQAR